jgi:uncharacterized radical SAM superfamily Fe-S cluster-containing enzyme
MMLRHATSLCPRCLRRLEAVYEQDGDTTYLRKTCPEHGGFSAPVWVCAGPDAPDTPGAPSFASWARPKSPSYPARPGASLTDGCPFDCGLCPAHAQHTCTALIEVTKRCDLVCPVCYADAGNKNAPDPPPAVVGAQLKIVKAASGSCNVQISGGEPTLREDLPAIVALARDQGFALVQINTNGLRLGRDRGYAEKLRAAGLDSVYLQWDGVSDAVFETLRGRACVDIKRKAVQACAAAGLGVVLVATLARNVNDAELGDLLRLALSLGSAVRGVHFQPAASFGRYPWEMRDAPRLTLPEIMRALALQAPELVRTEHFHPPGCEHALCSFSAVYARTADGLQWLPDAGQNCCSPNLPPVAAEGARRARQFVALHWKGSDKPESAQNLNDDFSRFLSRAGVEKRFTISAMAFQDALNLDIDRVRGCCIHVARPDGRLIPFCLHNLTSLDGARLYGDANNDST